MAAILARPQCVKLVVFSRLSTVLFRWFRLIEWRGSLTIQERCAQSPLSCAWVWWGIDSMLHISFQINTFRTRQDGRHFANIFECIFLNEDISISINISLTFVPEEQINNFPALVQIMAWWWPGDKPLSEPMMVNLLTHACLTRPQWVIWFPLRLSYHCRLPLYERIYS